MCFHAERKKNRQTIALHTIALTERRERNKKSPKGVVRHPK
jgi:hypothetical protein